MLRKVPVLILLAILLGTAWADPLPLALADAGIEERLGVMVDKDLSFKDETGKDVKLGDYFSRGRPVLLNFAYFHCPMLCGLVQTGMAKGLKHLDWVPGREYEILTISIDPHEGPEQAKPVKENLMADLAKPGAESGWHVLTGEHKAIESLTSVTGFKYNYIPDRNEFAHGAGLIFLSPDGKVSRYLYGVEFSSRDLRLALLDASEGRALSLGDKIEMFCYRYDANSKGYVLFAQNFMKAGGALVLVLLVILLVSLWRGELKRKRLSAAVESR